MTTLPLFIALAAGVLALALWPLLQVLRRTPAANMARAGAPHLGLLHAERAQLDADRAAGRIGPDEHAQAQAELARRVLQETSAIEPVNTGAQHRKLTAAVLLLAVPALAVGLYGTLGQPGALREAASPATEGATLADVDTMVRQMQQALERRSGTGNEAEDAQAWAMLARSQAGLQRHAQAAESYSRAIALDPRNPHLLADRADLISLLQGPGASAEAAQLVQRALAIDPQHPKALALAGRAAYEQQDFAAADAYWRRARAVAPPGSAFADGLDRSIEAARAGLQANASAGASTATAASAPAGISGRVEIAPALRERLQPGDTLFIIARTPQGPRLPLAVLRLPATAAPTEFALGDEHAMAADHKLSGQAQVVVEARVSRSGNAMPQAGDVLGRTGTIASTARGVRVVVDQVVP
ncbi:MAG: c-type cytochrome biogenesis protein CcmI [Comamonadaceae bacterium]|nr:MAG: c-type cytochrome biogenesis protein CcmI [Comamonadaceae bacterium]